MTANTPFLQVMEIERFAIHDGPGIRTVVFLQGCPLHCPWCANPESQATESPLMYSEKKCVGCGACADVAEEGAVHFISGQKPRFSREQGFDFSACISVCPAGALRLSGQKMTAEQVLQVVLRDWRYYRNSGGGLTLSGGEPFGQFEGFLALLEQAKAAELHIAVETTAQTPLSSLQRAEPYIDLFLLDLKHADASALETVTGANASLIFANMEWLAKTVPQKIVLRIPVIPGFNHNERDMRALFESARQLKLQTVHLLPYHTLGTEKYNQLGLAYAWPYPQMLQSEALAPWQEMGNALGLTVHIGD